MRRTDCYLKVIALALSLFACRTTAPATSDVAAGKAAIAKMQAFFATDRVVGIKVTAKMWEGFRNAEPAGGSCNFEWEGARYDWTNFEEMIIDGRSFKNVGVRKKSYCGSKSASRPSMNVDLSHFLEANKEIANDLIGTDRLVLNNSKQDAAYVRQCLAYQVFKEAGIAAPHCNFAHMVINDVDFGIFVNVQPMRKDFMNEIYGKDLGNLYEINKQNFTKEDLPLYKNALDAFGGDESMADMNGVIDALGPAGSPEKIEATVDVEQFTRSYATDIVLANWDGFFARLNNGYVYFPPKGKMQTLPWGPDKIMSEASVDGYEKFPLGTAGNRLLGALARQEAWRDRLKASIKDVTAKYFNPLAIIARMDTSLTKISPFVLAERREEFDKEVAELKKEINEREAKLQKVIDRISNYRVPIRNKAQSKDCWSATNFSPVACDAPEALLFNIISIRDMAFHIETRDGGQCLSSTNGALSLVPCADEEAQLWKAEKTDARQGRRETQLENKAEDDRCLQFSGKAANAKLVTGRCMTLGRSRTTDWIDDPL